MREFRRRAGVRLFLLGALALATGAAHAHIDTRTRSGRGEMFVPHPDRARFWALGFDTLVADYYWLQAIQVVGGTNALLGDRSGLVADLVEVTTRVDPWVDHPYRFAAVWLVESPEDVRRANHLLERGIAYHPLEWRNRYHLGFNHFFYLEEDERAADVLETAIGLEGAPSYLGGLVARLRAEGAGLEVAARFLGEMARDTEDPYARASYLKALDEILTEQAARHLDRARTEYWRRHGRDIERVTDLVSGSDPVLRSLPPAHPHFGRDFEWRIDSASGQIVSSFYGTRYGLYVHPLDTERQERSRQVQETGS